MINDNNQIPAVFKNASNPQPQPCFVIRRCNENDPFLVKNGLEEEAPCWLIKFPDGHESWALLEEVSLS